MLLYPVGVSDACHSAAGLLSGRGIPLTDHPSPEVTHLLLDVPSFLPGGLLRSGGELSRVLERLPDSITVVGGNLQHPGLSGYHTVDLLKNENYLANNAVITADCAIRIAGKYLKRSFRDSSALILGWGRIGRALGKLLKGLGSTVTVALRNERDRAMLRALGYGAVDYSELPNVAAGCAVVFNTVPQLVLEDVPKNCIAIDLASRPGIGGEGVIWALALPGKMEPESSGMLIADTVYPLLKEELP